MTLTKHKLLVWMLGTTLVAPVVALLSIYFIAQYAPAQIDLVLVPSLVLGYFYLPMLAVTSDARVIGNVVVFLSALSFWWSLAIGAWFLAGGRVVPKREAL